jgi:hypothetical protein
MRISKRYYKKRKKKKKRKKNYFSVYVIFFAFNIDYLVLSITHLKLYIYMIIFKV